MKIHKEVFSSLYTSDIDRARPYLPGYAYGNKPHYLNRNDDIEGSRPNKLHPPLEKVSYSLKNEDIDGAKPKSHAFITTRQPTNPVAPEYKIAYAEPRAITPPKFVRDQIDVKDIDGARPNPYTKYTYDTRTLAVRDIDGARPRKEWIPKKPFDSLYVKDINGLYIFSSQRRTNPLSPRYSVADENRQVVQYGEVQGNKSQIHHPKNPQRMLSFDLNTRDVDGAQAGSAYQVTRNIKTRTMINKIDDIPGARASSLKRGINTNRHVDPLRPVYILPGHSEMPPDYFSHNDKPVTLAKDYKKSQLDVSKSVDTLVKLAPVKDSNPIAENNIAFYENTTQIEPVRSKLPSSDGAPAYKMQRSASVVPIARGNGFNENRLPQSNLLTSTAEKSLLRASYDGASNTGRADTDRGLVSSSSEFLRDSLRFHGYEPRTQINKTNVRHDLSISQTLPGRTLNTKKQLVSSNDYQANVANFWGEEYKAHPQNQAKSMSQAQQLDRFLK